MTEKIPTVNRVGKAETLTISPTTSAAPCNPKGAPRLPAPPPGGKDLCHTSSTPTTFKSTTEGTGPHITLSWKLEGLALMSPSTGPWLPQGLVQREQVQVPVAQPFPGRICRGFGCILYKLLPGVLFLIGTHLGSDEIFPGAQKSAGEHFPHLPHLAPSNIKMQKCPFRFHAMNLCMNLRSN